VSAVRGLILPGAALIALGACDVQVGSSRKTSQDPQSLATIGADDRVRVCGVATEHLTRAADQPVSPPPAIVSARAVDADTLRLELGPDQVEGARNVECDFTAREVTWRALDGAAKATFSPETLDYEVENGTVTVSQSSGLSFKIGSGDQAAGAE
jgi:hypothetical protein